MKSLHFILLCLLTVAFCFFTQNFRSSAYSTLHPGRRIIRQVPASSPNHKDPCLQFQVNDDGRKQSTVEEGADKEDRIVYHIDYHGVTTHPTPTPKHPKP